MSVLRHGGAFLQRRLTKLYTDTKSSCESVSSASKANDDPELVALNRNFRTQKDRLLAWGLDWSDASAAQPNDIDEALSEAGFSDVVASVMSSIQELLNEAERLQQPDGVKSSDGLVQVSAVKATYTAEEIARSKELLEELTQHIETLYDLSRSRRNMSMGMSMNSNPPSASKGQGQGRPVLSKSSKSSKESFYSLRNDPGQSVDRKPLPAKKKSASVPQPGGGEFGKFHFAGIHGNTTAEYAEDFQKTFAASFLPTKEFYIDKSTLHLSRGGISHASNPPPYEAVAESANSRVIGHLETPAMPPALAAIVQGPIVPVLVEFSPILLEMQNCLQFPRRERLMQLFDTLQRLVENSRVSHLGLLKFVGYFVDMTYSRYAFVYQIPLEMFPLLRQPSDVLRDVKPRPLVSLFHSGEGRPDSPIPNLESRFRLAYHLILAVLHLRSQNIVHGNINSNNILVFPDFQVPNKGLPGDSSSDFSHPYLTSLAQFDSEDKNSVPEPLSASMYRHPDDRRVITDNSSWAYDLYSLGLVLLEIGLWTPLSKFWKMKYNNSMFKSRIENVYVKRLAPKCGNSYMQIVQLCLDAPNFHLSTEPMTDLGLRIRQTYHYPWHDPSTSDEWNTFSKNFVYTIGKVSWRCACLDVFSPPPASDLDECLPPPLVIEPTSSSFQEINNYDIGRQPDVTMPIDPADDGTTYGASNEIQEEKGTTGEKKVRKRTLKKWSNVEIPEEDLRQWNMTLMPKLSKLLQKILKDSPESCSASLMVAGETAETAKTTICVTCTNIRRVRVALKKYFDYDRENWDLIVIRGDVTRSKVPRRRRRKPKTNNRAIAAQTDLNPNFQTKPVCGASIGAFRLDEHLPPVSYGGAILVDGMPYGMTVHHMLDAPCDDDDDDDGEEEEDDDDGYQDLPSRSAGNWTPGGEAFDQAFSYSWRDDEPPEALYPFEISDDEEDPDDGSVAPSIDESYDDYWLSDGYSSDEGDEDPDEDDDYDSASIGDTAGVDPGEEPRIIVTQPAIDDVEDGFFPTAEDRDDEHLASHSLGYVHASSGVRRWKRGGMKHEVDWALIKIDENRMDINNAILTDVDASEPHCSSSSNVTRHRGTHRQQNPKALFATLDKVARIEDLAGLHVQCCGRTSGLQSGRISKAIALVKMHGRQSFSSSFSVDGNFGVPGDSGAWVFDKSTSKVCGHVLAWSEKNRTAYIAPMEILLDDIARTLGAISVTLPGSEEALAWNRSTNPSRADASPFSGTFPAAPAAVASQPHMRMGLRIAHHEIEPLPVELGRLSIDRDEQGRGRGGAKGLRDVSSSTYRAVAPLIRQSYTMERQLA
ncbi:serine/threonine protein kinase [Emergomyces africanus]|uniref:Serine/threonine protein kinase n=1 Tax=Emergomyces africanus TaxID=1955775 RepID=A0A1B7NVB4_9EURO|nr:serine/threonine protein kinase [Emergomyces africanus]